MENKLGSTKWLIEKVLVPILVAVIAAYATLVVAKVLPNPFRPGEKPTTSTFSSISSNSNVNALYDGQTLISPNGQHILKIENGNLILYSNGSNVWMTNTEWSGADHLVIQSDGNLVLYAKDRYVWDTSTAVVPPDKSYTLDILDNGNLVVYNSTGGVIWSIK